MSDTSSSTTAKNAGLDAKRVLANSGFLRVYSGVVPANADASIGAAPLLVQYTLSATAFAAASGGTISANAITAAAVLLDGVHSFWRIYASNGTTCLWQGLTAVGASPVANRLTYASSVLNAGGISSVPTFTLTEPS